MPPSSISLVLGSDPVAPEQIARLKRNVLRTVQRLLGMGGVQNWQDAVEFILAGATAVGIGTALFVDPTIPMKVADGIEQYLRDQNLTSVEQLIGQLDTE